MTEASLKTRLSARIRNLSDNPSRFANPSRQQPYPGCAGAVWSDAGARCASDKPHAIHDLLKTRQPFDGQRFEVCTKAA